MPKDNQEEGLKLITIKTAKPSDVPALYTLESACFSDPWSTKSLRDTINEERSFFLTAADGDKIIGYLNATYVCDEMNLNRVCVLSDYRNRGAGYAMIQAMLSFGREKKLKTAFLEVRASNNGARRLYSRCGFTEAGRRRNYYINPAEDGIVMTAEL